MTADYSQIELRLLAHCSGDANLKQAFAEGQDIHSAVASLVFGVPADTVNKDQRRVANRQAAGGRAHRQERLPSPQRRGAGLDQLAGDAGRDRVAVVGRLERAEAAVAGEARLQRVL